MATRTILLVSSILLHARAHMFISSPSPIAGTFRKDPLDASGSNFPCHGISLPKAGGQSMAAGSSQTLKFDLGGGANTAVHGGGSCQMSITYETDPTKQKDPANWKVIYSIEGGCPSDATGNLDEAIACTGSNGPNCVNSFPFKIPRGIKNGHAIMAWTWFNSVGNRELYMNCINTQFTGGDGSEMDSFPSMFVANLASVNDCPTTESVNVKYPNAGKYVTTKTQGNSYPLAVPTGAGCSSKKSDSPKEGSSSKSPASPSSRSATSTTKTTHPSATATPHTAPAPSATSSAESIPKGSSSNCPGKSVTCSMTGAIICVDDQHFGICNLNHCAVPQNVAPGTICQGGKIARNGRRDLTGHIKGAQNGHHHGHGH